MPVAIAFRWTVAPIIAKSAKKAGQFLLENGFDGRTDVGSQPLLDRIEPGFTGQ